MPIYSQLSGDSYSLPSADVDPQLLADAPDSLLSIFAEPGYDEEQTSSPNYSHFHNKDIAGYPLKNPQNFDPGVSMPVQAPIQHNEGAPYNSAPGGYLEGGLQGNSGSPSGPSNGELEPNPQRESQPSPLLFIGYLTGVQTHRPRGALLTQWVLSVAHVGSSSQGNSRGTAGPNTSGTQSPRSAANTAISRLRDRLRDIRISTCTS